MIIGLWGKSATAKTTIAKHLAVMLDLPLRSCGDEIRVAATSAGISLAQAPLGLHAEVDRLTRAWSDGQSAWGAIVEGRFLDRVLADRADTLLVHVTCAEHIRAQRLSERLSKPLTPAALVELDKLDDLFRDTLYGPTRYGVARETLDTSGGGVEQWVNDLSGWIRRFKEAARG